MVAASDMDDGALIGAMADGSREAFGTLYDRYCTLMLAVGTRILRDRREAEDLVHDVFVEAWKQAPTYDASRGTVRTWLLLRLRSRALDRRKSAGSSRVTPVEPGKLAQSEVAAPSDPSDGPDRAAVIDALSNLSNDQRAVVELAYFEGLSCSEIAERVAIPIGTVKSRMAAALTKLRSELGPYGGGEP